MGQYRYITWYIEPNNLNQKKRASLAELGVQPTYVSMSKVGIQKKDPQFSFINSLLVPCVHMTHWALVFPARQQSIPMRHALVQCSGTRLRKCILSYPTSKHG